MSNIDQKYKKLKQVASKSLQSLSSNIIVKVKDDYIVFRRYTITPTKDGYFAVRRAGDVLHEFTSSRNALAFCILEQHARIEESIHLLNEDKRIQRLEWDIVNHKHIMDTTKDNERRMLMADLVINDIAIRGDIKIKLRDTINLAKYYQQKGFDNETARTRNK